MFGRFPVSAKGHPGFVIFFQRPGFVLSFFQRNFIQGLISSLAFGAGFLEKRPGSLPILMVRDMFLSCSKNRAGCSFGRGVAGSISPGQRIPNSAMKCSQRRTKSGDRLPRSRAVRKSAAESQRLISTDDCQGVHQFSHFRRLVARQRNPQVDQVILHLAASCLNRFWMRCWAICAARIIGMP